MFEAADELLHCISVTFSYSQNYSQCIILAKHKEGSSIFLASKLPNILLLLRAGCHCSLSLKRKWDLFQKHFSTPTQLKKFLHSILLLSRLCLAWIERILLHFLLSKEKEKKSLMVADMAKKRLRRRRLVIWKADSCQKEQNSTNLWFVCAKEWILQLKYSFQLLFCVSWTTSASSESTYPAHRYRYLIQLLALGLEGMLCIEGLLMHTKQYCNRP